MKEYQVEDASRRLMVRLDIYILRPIANRRLPMLGEGTKQRMKRWKDEVGEFVAQNRDRAWPRGVGVPPLSNGAFDLVSSVYWSVITSICWDESPESRRRENETILMRGVENLSHEIKNYYRRAL